MKKIFTMMLLLCCSIMMYAQGCYTFTRNKGLDLFNSGKYAEARSQFVAAKSCPDKPSSNDLDDLIRRCDEKLTTFKITDVDLHNVESDGTEIDGFGYALYADRIKYVKPKLTYTSNVDKTVTISVKLYRPNNNLMTGSNSPSGYTYTSDLTLESGTHSVEILGWGNKSGGTYSEGSYKFEFWYNNKLLTTKSFYVFAGDGGLGSGSGSGSNNNYTSSYNNGGRKDPIRGKSWETMLDKLMRNAKTLSGGDKYLGQYRDGNREGWGIYKWADGTIYIGEWEKGDFDGGAMYLCPDEYQLRGMDDSQFFAGYYKNDVRTAGRVYDTYGNMLYIGDFDSNGAPEDKYPAFSTTSPFLVITYTNGDIFIGETSSEEPYGFGLYLWADGGAWFGFWQNGVRKGRGFYVSDSGSITSGTWDNNTMK